MQYPAAIALPVIETTQTRNPYSLTSQTSHASARPARWPWASPTYICSGRGARCYGGVSEKVTYAFCDFIGERSWIHSSLFFRAHGLSQSLSHILSHWPRRAGPVCRPFFAPARPARQSTLCAPILGRCPGRACIAAGHRKWDLQPISSLTAVDAPMRSRTLADSRLRWELHRTSTGLDGGLLVEVGSPRNFRDPPRRRLRSGARRGGEALSLR